jgi:dethiobiotin synthetase
MKIELVANKVLSQGCIVTGTDTNIGKTHISGLLCQALQATYWKPIQTGYPADDDTRMIRETVGCKTLEPIYRLSAPLAPLYAARVEGVIINPELLKNAPAIRPLVIEGAGGLLVPFTDSYLFRDFLKGWGLPVVVVTACRLGTINHTLLTLEGLAKIGANVAGVIINGDSEPIHITVLKEQVRDVPILGVVPWKS